MASPSVASTLDQISSSPTTDQPAGYTTLLNTISSNSPDPPTQTTDLTTTITSILSSPLGIVALRPLLTSTITTISSLPSPAQIITTGTHLLTLLEPRAVSFEEASSQLRHTLADAHESCDDWSASARTLQGINLESSQRQISDHSKVTLWIRICRLYLEDDDTTTAESYLNRAKNLLYRVTGGSESDTKDTEALTINFQLCQARILDAQRKFLDASTAYHNISYNSIIDESERLHTLAMAITCAVLAGAGPARARSLGRLYKDERAAGLTKQYGMLEKMFLDRLLQKEEVEQFAAGLSPHQVARTGDGTTVLGRAVVEHNLLSASRVYENIGLGALAGLLGFEGEGVGEGEGGWERAEGVASGMLQQGRLGGRIDQIEGVIYFGEGGKGKGGVELGKWDGRVRGLAEDVERVASLVQMEYPEWSQANMVH